MSFGNQDGFNGNYGNTGGSWDSGNSGGWDSNHNGRKNSGRGNRRGNGGNAWIPLIVLSVLAVLVTAFGLYKTHKGQWQVVSESISFGNIAANNKDNKTDDTNAGQVAAAIGAITNTNNTQNNNANTQTSANTQTAANTAILPANDLFFNCSCADEGFQASTNNYYYSCTFNMDNGGEKAVEEYLALFSDAAYGLTLRNVDESDTRSVGSLFRTYYYDYRGSHSVEMITDYDGNPVGNARVLVAYYYDEGRISVNLGYAKGFTMVDSGKHTSYNLTDYGPGTNGGGTNGGGTSIFDDDDDPYRPTYDCIKCGGDGDITCSNCNGDGGKYVTDNSTPNYSGSLSGSKTGRTWQNCYKCHGSGEITCTSCHGSGNR